MLFISAALKLWGILIALAALIMAFARTSPQDAASNLSKWLQLIGIQNMPAWMKRASFDSRAFRWAQRMMVALFLIGGVGGLVYLFSARPQPPAPGPIPNIEGDCNAVGNNNSNCSINIAPRRLAFTDAIKKLLLEKIPKGKPGHVEIIGPHQEDTEVGIEIYNFLIANGYNVDNPPEIIGENFPMPSKALTLTDNPSMQKWVLKIAPSAF